MTHSDNSPPVIRDVLEKYRKIAVVGLSPKSDRPSYEVTAYMIEHGYEIVGVRPAGPKEILGKPCYPSLKEIPGQLEIVDVFRSPEHIPPLIDELIPLKPKVIWLQLGISHPEAEAKARAAGITVISDRCILVEHSRYSR
jgi:predicted CoA-binding protein